MADIWSELEDDVADIIQADGDSVTWTTSSGANTVLVFWQGDSIEDEGLGPRFDIATADIPAAADYDDTITRNATNYKVAKVGKDGHGLSTILLVDA